MFELSESRADVRPWAAQGRVALRIARFFGIIFGMRLDPTKMKDWQIAEAAEENLKPAAALAQELGLQEDESTPYSKVLA